MKTSGRHEIKHYINRADFIQLRSRLPYVAAPDEHALDSDGYRVRSLYFDNYDDKVLREKVDGVNDREKFRLRLYNGDPSFIRLEKKSKKSGLCFKESAVITSEECTQVIMGGYGTPKDNGHPLLLEFYTKLHSELLRPKNIVDYMRLSYTFNAGNVRITLDYDIRTSFDTGAFLNPEIIRGMVSLGSGQQTAFSKYAAARTI